MSVQIYTKYGKKIQKDCDLKDLLNNVAEGIPPGTYFEAIWDSNLYLLDVIEICFYGVLKSKIYLEEMKCVDVPEESLTESSNSVSKSDTQLVAKVKDCPISLDEVAVSKVFFVDTLKYIKPLIPTFGKLGILKLPPDDWSMEAKVRGERVIIIIPPNTKYSAMDIRETPYDLRSKIREKLVSKIQSNHINIIPKVDYNFPGSYREWKDDDRIEGIVMKKRSSSYKKASDSSNRIDFWLKYLFPKESFEEDDDE